MSAELLYFLGAGASCEALPLVSDFPDRLSRFSTLLSNTLQIDDSAEQESRTNIDLNETRTQLIDSVKWLAENAANHASVDTFAKKLFFKGDMVNLKRLKATLSVYLVVEQSLNHVDKRYDSFLASILEFDERRYVRLPENIRIMTWNYDTQLEKAFFGFCEDDNMVTKRITFNDNIYRINGYCGTLRGRVGNEFCSVWKLRGKDALENGIRLYAEYMKSSSEPDIRFAWESSAQILKNRIDEMNLDKIRTVVAIGYSFPYFNREIDKLIFGRLKNVSKFYLQYPNGEHISIEERLNRIKSSDAKSIHIKARDLFHMPDEY